MINAEWKNALIDIDRAAEFTGDDVDRYSKLIDLGAAFSEVVIQVPTIDSAAVSVYAQETDAIATVPKIIHAYKPEAAGNAAWATTAGTGLIVVSCKSLGWFRYIRLYTGANQAADRTFRVCGIK